MKWIGHKLSKKGFSISEMLMALLVISITMIVVGGGVTVIKDAYKGITQKAEAQTLLSTVVTAVTDDLRFADEIKSSGVNLDNETVADEVDSGNYEFDSLSRGYRMCFSNKNPDDDFNIYVRPVGGGEILPIVTENTSAGLFPQIGSITYDDAENPQSFAIEIKICREGENGEIDTVNPLASTPEDGIVIRPINSDK